VIALPVRRVQRARLAALFGIASLTAVMLGGPATAAAAAGTALAFQAQPGGGPAGMVWAQQPVVRIVDGSGQTDTTSHAMVTLAVANNPSGGSLTCAGGLTVAAVNGVATFSGCAIDVPGTGYTLIAAANALSAVVSSAFTIGPVTGPVPHLEFVVATSNPGGLTGTAGGPLNFSFEVHVEDANGNLVTAGDVSTTPVTLGMATNGAGAQVTCSGGLTVAAVAGVAKWTGCSVTPAATGLMFTAAAQGFATVNSPAFSILAGGAAPTLTITASRTVILWGEGVDLTIHLSVPAGSSASVAGRTIHVQVAKVNTALGFSTINPGGDVTTDSTGTAVIANYTPATNLWYQAVFDGSTDLGPIVSAETRVVVRQLALIKPDNAGLVKTIAKGTSVEFRTVARPSRDDIPRTHVKWEIWRLVNNRWILFLTQTSDPDVSGTAFFTIQFNTGSWRIRSQAMPTQLNANSVWTPFVQYLVK